MLENSEVRDVGEAAESGTDAEEFTEDRSQKCISTENSL